MWQSIKNQYHLVVAILATLRYGFPGRKLTIIGVTGTDGKTTTVNLIYHMLKTAGKTVSMVSTVGANINGQESLLNFHVTTPSSFAIQRFLSLAAKGSKEKKYVVLEVSSHAIDQFRVWGVPFSVGVITNITNEHLDYHKTYSNYLQTKAKLLQSAAVAVLNSDDDSYTRLLPLVSEKKVITYGIHKKADVAPQEYPYKSPLIGEFNEYNMLACFAVGKYLGIEKSDMQKAMSTFATPLGRMNTIENTKGLTIVVDYAHTPNGLTQALTALKKNKKESGRLIVLTGAEGKRDPGKREAIGEAAGSMSDIVVITAVDPRGEEAKINAAILRGVEKNGKILGKNVFIENDRETAIAFTLKKLAKKGDTVGLFGKGHERSMNYDGKHEISWSDTDVVKKVLKV